MEKGGHLVTRMHSKQFSLEKFFETEYRVAGSALLSHQATLRCLDESVDDWIQEIW